MRDCSCEHDLHLRLRTISIIAAWKRIIILPWPWCVSSWTTSTVIIIITVISSLALCWSVYVVAIDPWIPVRSITITTTSSSSICWLLSGRSLASSSFSLCLWWLLWLSCCLHFCCYNFPIDKIVISISQCISTGLCCKDDCVCEHGHLVPLTNSSLCRNSHSMLCQPGNLPRIARLGSVLCLVRSQLTFSIQSMLLVSCI